MKHRYRTTQQAVASALFLVAVAGCSSDSDAPATTPTTPAVPPVTTPDGPGTTPDGPGTTPDMPVEMPGAAGLDGEWLRACGASDPEDADTTYDTVALTIDGTSATSRRLDYTDSTCQTPASPAETIITVSIEYPPGTSETPRGAATFIDVTPESISRDGVEPTAEVREELAAVGAFDPRYDIALVDGGELYFGDLESDEERDGRAPDRRPETLESTPYVRQ